MHSTVCTVGTALRRARDHGVDVRVLVSGYWIDGAVSEIDGHGVIPTGPDSSHHVVRLTDVSVGDEERADQDGEALPVPVLVAR